MIPGSGSRYLSNVLHSEVSNFLSPAKTQMLPRREIITDAQTAVLCGAVAAEKSFCSSSMFVTPSSLFHKARVSIASVRKASEPLAWLSPGDCKRPQRKARGHKEGAGHRTGPVPAARHGPASVLTVCQSLLHERTKSDNGTSVLSSLSSLLCFATLSYAYVFLQ